jgi:hypothetical protein
MGRIDILDRFEYEYEYEKKHEQIGAPKPPPVRC